MDVIKDWNLDYHLACAVKYIARANHKKPILEDLRKAVWHLERAWPKENRYHHKFNSQQTQLERATYSPQTVCDDWNLPNLLCSTLINIFLSQRCSSHPLKIKVLNAALDYLREEVIFLEKNQVFKLSLRISTTR
jgi:hypothetical protein